jgi:hypothetical protein
MQYVPLSPAIKQATNKGSPMLTVILSLAMSLANATPADAVYIIGGSPALETKAKAQAALLVDLNALVYGCKPMIMDRKGIKAKGTELYIVGKQPSGSLNKVDGMRAVALGKEALECKRKAVNEKGNLTNF